MLKILTKHKGLLGLLMIMVAHCDEGALFDKLVQVIARARPAMVNPSSMRSSIFQIQSIINIIN
jgi:hypothetical protein